MTTNVVELFDPMSDINQLVEARMNYPDFGDQWLPTHGLWNTEWTRMPVRYYQIIGINWLLKYKRCLLRDRPGVGKTIQAAYAADYLGGPTAVFCPGHLVEQWYEWLTGQDDVSMALNNGQVVPNVRGSVAIAKGTYWQKLQTMRAGHDWVVTNIETLQTHCEHLTSLQEDGGLLGVWKTIIYDEAHYLRNWQAKRSKTAVAISTEEWVDAVFLLTASPIWKEPDDLFNQFRIMLPDVFTSYNQFVELFCVYDDGMFGRQVMGVKPEMRDELEELLNGVSMGRTAQDVGRVLPPAIPKTIKVEFPKKLRDHYDGIIADWATEWDSGRMGFENFSQVLVSLRLITRFPGKYEAAAEAIEDELKFGRVMVVGWYKDTIYESVKYFNHLGKVACITGEVKDKSERRRIAQDPQNKIVVVNYSLTEGVDLSDCRAVVFLEEHYSPGSNDQILSRVVRERVRAAAGAKTDPVNVYYIQVKNSIDEVIHRRAQRREGTVKELIREAIGR